MQNLIPPVALFTLVSPLARVEYKTPKCVQMLGTTQPMVARNEMEFDRKRRSKGSQLLDELATALRQNHAVLLAVENGRADRPSGETSRSSISAT